MYVPTNAATAMKPSSIITNCTGIAKGAHNWNHSIYISDTLF